MPVKKHYKHIQSAILHYHYYISSYIILQYCYYISSHSINDSTQTRYSSSACFLLEQLLDTMGQYRIQSGSTAARYHRRVVQ